MLKIERLAQKDTSPFRDLLLKIFDEGFDYYPEEANIYNKNHWTKALIEKYLDNNDFLFLTAKKNGQLAGYLIGKLTSYGSTILWLGVAKRYRNQKMGSGLVKYWQDWSKENGAGLLKLSTANFKNEGFYKKMGFNKKPNLVKNDWGMSKFVFFKNT